MRNYTLNIAGYNIRFESQENAPELIPSPRFKNSIRKKADADLLIRVHGDDPSLPRGARRVFHAPYFGENDGTISETGNNFWSVYRYSSDIYVKTIFPLLSTKNKGILRLSLTDLKWDLWLKGHSGEADPMEYPLDALILYYLTIFYGDIMIHASGINNAGRGYLFSGVSGKGKTTLAKLWYKTGATVINDDRLILRKNGGGYVMHNIPFYIDDEPRVSPVHKIYLIGHGQENRQELMRGASAVSHVVANCIQQNWSREIIAQLLGSVSIMCSTLPVFMLSFVPDRRIIEYILENE
jgi:hypothetical protein